jgi:hypothetical protein
LSKLVICEKPSVAKSIASALGVTSRADGYFEDGDWLISWCIGHLVGLADAAAYDDRYKKWRYEDLPILPNPFRYVVSEEKADQFHILRSLMERPDVTELVNACDAGREGDHTAGVSLQEGSQLLVVHAHRLDHADDLQVFFLGELRLQLPKALLLGGDLLLRLFNVLADLLNRCHKLFLQSNQLYGGLPYA